MRIKHVSDIAVHGPLSQELFRRAFAYSVQATLTLKSHLIFTLMPTPTQNMLPRIIRRVQDLIHVKTTQLPTRRRIAGGAIMIRQYPDVLKEERKGDLECFKYERKAGIIIIVSIF